jgi:hypothetical protein
MTRTEIVAVAIRLLAAWFFFNVVVLMALVPPPDGTSVAWSLVLASMVRLALVGGVCFATWKFSALLAGKVIPPSDPDDQVVPLSGRDLERVGLRVLGVFLTFVGLAGLGNSFVYAAALAGISGAGSWVQELGSIEVAPQLTQYLIELLGGVLLFAGRAGLRRFLERLKGEGEMESPVDDESGPSSEDGDQ